MNHALTLALFGLSVSLWASLSSCGKDVDQISPTTPSSTGTIQIVDVEGNMYNAIQIGEDWWMAENLRTTHFSDGSVIPHIAGNDPWSQASSAAWSINPNILHFDSVYGKFYNWYAVDDARGICPTGWHVPSDTEWKSLESSLGMPNSALDLIGHRGADQNVGEKLKSATLWNGPSSDATNESRFSGLPSGYRSEGTGEYEWILWQGIWWTATEDADNAWLRGLFSHTPAVNRDKHSKQYGFCVRCVMDR